MVILRFVRLFDATKTFDQVPSVDYCKLCRQLPKDKGKGKGKRGFV